MLLRIKLMPTAQDTARAMSQIVEPSCSCFNYSCFCRCSCRCTKKADELVKVRVGRSDSTQVQREEAPELCSMPCLQEGEALEMEAMGGPPGGAG